MKRINLLLALSAIAALGVVSASALAQTAHKSASAAVVTTKKTNYGTILVTSSGKTLYLDAGDKGSKFACNGGCLLAWPPYATSGKPKASGSAKASDLGTIKHGKVTQVTYKGHALYTFASDSSSAPISGEGVNGFYVVSPSGSKITSAGSNGGGSSGGGY